MIEWDEPYSHDPLINLHCSMTREDAIKYQQAYVSQARPEFTYKDNDEALYDFMTVRWARDTDNSKEKQEE